MTTPRHDARTDTRDEAGPLGSELSEPDGEDADAMAGPVYPPEETEPDAQH